MDSYFISTKNGKVDFSTLKEPFKTELNRMKCVSESNGYGFIVGYASGGTYEKKVLSFWFREISTKKVSAIYTLPKDLKKLIFSIKIANYEN